MTKFIAWGQEVSHDRERPQPPGNTLPIVDFAYGLGFDGVELDVQVSKDGVIVLMHDFTLDRSTLEEGVVAHRTLEELRQVRVRGEWGGRPLYVEPFEEALRINGSRGYVMCDLRRVSDKSLAGLQNSITNSGFDPELLLIIAYNKEDGLRLKQAFPASTILLKSPVSPPVSGFVAEADGLDALLINAARQSTLVEEIKAKADARGMKLCVYLDHRGLPIQNLKKLVAARTDFVTTQNHHYFDQLRHPV